MSAETDQVNVHAFAVFAACDRMCAMLREQGIDQRGIVIGMTAFLGRALAMSALPGHLGQLLKATQESLGEQAMRAGEVMGHG